MLKRRVTTMLNKRPIFIVGFARGGSNIVLNFFRSHPDICSPRGETNEVFKGRPAESFDVRFTKLLRYLPIMLVERHEIFSAACWADRRPFCEITKKRIDKILYDEKFRARLPTENLYRFEDVEYTREEIAHSRLLCKNLNGLIFLSRQFAEMYPDATFIGLVRNGFAVCEGHIRRGRYNVSEISQNYHKACQRLIEDSRQLANFHIFQFEDILSDPLGTLKRLYQAADLDISIVKNVRLEITPVITERGTHSFASNKDLMLSKKFRWYKLDEMHKHFSNDVNENQIKNLDHKSKEIIKANCKNTLEYFNYI